MTKYILFLAILYSIHNIKMAWQLAQVGAEYRRAAREGL